MNIYVGNLSFDTTEADLRRVFEAHGEVASVLIIQDRVSENALGFGFVEMPDAKKAREAAEAVNGTTINGRSVIASEAQSKGDRRSISRVAAASLNFN